jgi:hypothetical protein
VVDREGNERSGWNGKQGKIRQIPWPLLLLSVSIYLNFLVRQVIMRRIFDIWGPWA